MEGKRERCEETEEGNERGAHSFFMRVHISVCMYVFCMYVLFYAWIYVCVLTPFHHLHVISLSRRRSSTREGDKETREGQENERREEKEKEMSIPRTRKMEKKNQTTKKTVDKS